MQVDRRIYVNADRSKVVEESDPDAAFLLATPGDVLSDEDVKRYGLNKTEPKAEPESRAAEKPADAKAVTGPPENKAQTGASKKTDEGK